MVLTDILAVLTGSRNWRNEGLKPRLAWLDCRLCVTFAGMCLLRIATRRGESRMRTPSLPGKQRSLKARWQGLSARSRLHERRRTTSRSISNLHRLVLIARHITLALLLVQLLMVTPRCGAVRRSAKLYIRFPNVQVLELRPQLLAAMLPPCPR